MLKKVKNKNLLIILLSLSLFFPACKSRESTSEALDHNPNLPTSMIIVALGGPSDKGEVVRATFADLQRCLANPWLRCFMLLPPSDSRYRPSTKLCDQHPRCAYKFVNGDQEILQLLTTFSHTGYNTGVGLLIGHHTGDGIWDHPDLTPSALNSAAGFPLVLRICNSSQFAQGSDGLVPVGEGLLPEQDVTHVDIIRRILSGEKPPGT